MLWKVTASLFSLWILLFAFVLSAMIQMTRYPAFIDPGYRGPVYLQQSEPLPAYDVMKGNSGIDYGRYERAV